MQGDFGPIIFILKLFGFGNNAFSATMLHKINSSFDFWSHTPRSEHSLIQELFRIMDIQKFPDLLIWLFVMKINIRDIRQDV